MNSATQSFVVPTDPATIAADLTLIGRQRRAGVRAAGAIWFPLLVGGIATIAAPGAIDLIEGDAAPAWYWGFAGPLIALACAVFYATRRVQLPTRSGAMAVAVAIAIVIGAPVAALITAEPERNSAPVIVAAGGLAAFALIYRSVLVGLVALAHTVAAIVMLATESTIADDVATIGSGLTACLCGPIGVLLLDAVAPVER